MTGTEIGLVVGFVGLLITGGMALRTIINDQRDRSEKLETKLRTEFTAGDQKVSDRLDEHEEAIAEQLLDQERTMRAQDESIRQAMGEQGHAIRTHVQHLEVWVRDNLVSKEDFGIVTGRLEVSIDRLGKQVEDLPDRLIKRIDERRPAA